MSFFKKASYKVFNFQPRYYDAAKERRNLQAIGSKEYIKTSIRNSFKQHRRESNITKNTSWKVFFILLILVMLIWMFDFSFF